MKKMIIKRTFNAPVEEVWDAWTNPDVLKDWWSPAGMRNAHLSVELTEGGRFRYCFKDKGSKEYWGRGEYKTINPPHYLAYIDSFTDAQGNDVAPSHYGMPGDELLLGLVEVELTGQEENTHLIITMDNPYEESMTADMETGWNSMLDKLDEILTT